MRGHQILILVAVLVLPQRFPEVLEVCGSHYPFPDRR